jgi:hypothetical protein
MRFFKSYITANRITLQVKDVRLKEGEEASEEYSVLESWSRRKVSFVLRSKLYSFGNISIISSITHID